MGRKTYRFALRQGNKDKEIPDERIHAQFAQVTDASYSNENPQSSKNQR